jgi:pSer/pThr/pTyr-binding forkhead associated (FHA) protein
MNFLILEWQEIGQHRTQKIYEQQPSKHPGTCRIGRDPHRCDIVITDPTVSGLHVEIFFDHKQQGFYIKNLRDKNPPQVDGKILQTGEVLLNENSIIYLGKQQFKVTTISVVNIPETIIVSPPEKPTNQKIQPSPPTQPLNPEYGLECPQCHKISPPENLQVGCPWCGTSLAAAVSVLISKQ